MRLIILNFLEFAIWGAYLTSLGRYLGQIGLGPQIKWFFAMQGIVSIFMPALTGILADKHIQAQKVLSLCQGLAGVFMIAAGLYCKSADAAVAFSPLFILYSLSVAFFMPTIALSNTVAYNALSKAGQDPVKAYPPIRIRYSGIHLQYACHQLGQDRRSCNAGLIHAADIIRNTFPCYVRIRTHYAAVSC